MNLLLAGMGFVGQPLAQALLAKGHHVVGLTRSTPSLQRLSTTCHAKLRQADVADIGSLQRALPKDDAHAFDWVIHCASSGRGGTDTYRNVYYHGLANLHAICPRARLLFTSSTSVYAQTDGSRVDENSPAIPHRETGQILRATEDIALSSGGIVARLAGIYGPGRSYILLKYLTRTAVIEGRGGRYLNQAHREDIVSALVHLLTRKATGIFNIVDSTPQTQLQIYRWLAGYFHGELPPPAPPDYQRRRGWTHKRVSNARLLSTGWSPRYPSLQDAITRDPTLVPSIQALVTGDA